MSDNMLDCAVIIVNYRQPVLTEQTVASLRKADGFARLAVYVVDNGSNDGSYERLQTSCADCFIFSGGANLGFSGGNNVGIRAALAAGAKWVLLLNNDTEVEPGFLVPLLDAAKDGRTIVTPKIVYADDPTKVWYAGGYVRRCRGGFYHVTEQEGEERPKEVSFASGCCMLIPATFFRECGLLDESFFLYYEDAELCLRASRNGYRIWYVPQSVIRHKVSASTGGEDSPLAVYYGTRNRLELLRRYRFPWYATLFVMVTRLVKCVASPHRLRRIAGLVDYLRGHMSNQIVVNGVFVGRRASGLERFAFETLRALDSLVAPGRVQVLVPRSVDCTTLSSLRNIKVVCRGVLKGGLWEQITLPWYVWKTGAEVLSLTNTVPLLRPGPSCIHDVFYITHADEFRRSLRGRLSMYWHRLHYRAIARSGKPVFTVSNYSKGQIESELKVSSDRITVLGNGWEHIERIAEEVSVFARFPQIEKGNYCFTLGNRSPYKNLAWVMAAAERSPGIQWVVTGGKLLGTGAEVEMPSNVIATGYVTDGEMKALMANCRVLVHPSLDEGFGIPPLEALAMGRSTVVSRRASLPEIFGGAVQYIEHPEQLDDADLLRCFEGYTSDTSSVLGSCTWRNVAVELYSALNEVVCA
ncbi:MAG: glycosyltransferase [Kiritimatiellae bacterium]|nr:glycosyltransferase [Kiritimatiellia bacterium]